MHKVEIEKEVIIPITDSLEPDVGCPDTLLPIYLEKDGLLLIEMESSNFEATQSQLDSTSIIL